MSDNHQLSVHHEPFIRIIKRQELTKPKAILLRIAAFVIAIFIGGIFILMLGKNPVETYGVILKGSFVGSARNPLSAIQATIIIAIPLLICSLGLSFAFKLKFWNIGAEGQLIFGAICASWLALRCSGLPHIVLMLLMFIAGAVGGGLWALIPAIFKVKFGTNETLFTLMLNYIALYIVKYLESGPWQTTKGFASVGRFDKNSFLAEVGGVHVGWIIAIILVIFVYIYLNHTKSGYEISVVGESQSTARYAGMNVSKIILKTMFFSGAICGIAGMLQVSGIDHTLSTGVAGGVGFTAITVSWLSHLNPFMISFITAMFSILEKGSGVMQTTIKLSAAAADVLQGIILFSFLGCEFFTRYKFAFRNRGGNK